MSSGSEKTAFIVCLANISFFIFEITLSLPIAHCNGKIVANIPLLT